MQSQALNHYCTNQLQSASEMEFPFLEENHVLLIYYIQWQALECFDSACYSWDFFTVKPNVIAKNNQADHLVQFSLLWMAVMFHFEMWLRVFFREFCQNYSTVCIDDFGRNQEVGILSSSWNKAGLQSNKSFCKPYLILSFYAVYLKYWFWLLLLLKLVSNNSWKCLPRQVFSTLKGTRFMARCQIPV